MSHLIDVFLHLDMYLDTVIQQYGVWMYFILFVVVFLETGIVVTPFLPGDSLLFAAGALCARGDLALCALVPGSRAGRYGELQHWPPRRPAGLSRPEPSLQAGAS